MKKTALLFIILVLLAGAAPRVSFMRSLSAQIEPAHTSKGFNMEDAVINVAETAGKAVVSISTEHTEKINSSRRYYRRFPSVPGQNNEDELLRRFFDDFFGQMPDREYKKAGLGSGVIINHDGYILTNEHVISEADKITVTLSDGREFAGQIKGQDPRSDLAVIKINAKDLPVASLGDSDSIKIGQWVVAIGNPYAFAMQSPEPTVTAGVISALHRSLGRGISQDRDYNDLIQTDAAINPGNSGGPLVNLKGEVVGINVAIFSTNGGNMGIGFAIPINSAKRIITKLIEGKKIVYGWLGITVQNLTPDLAKHFGTNDKNGVLVAKVLDDSPAARSGMREGDIIVRIDTKEVNSVKDLLGIVGRSEVGKAVKVEIIRDKRPSFLNVVIGERPQNVEEGAVESTSGSWRGLNVEDLNSEIAKRFRTQEKQGVLVVNIEPNSSAEDAGLIAGDVILEINKQPVKNVTDYDRLVKGVSGNVLVRTSRGYFLIKAESEK